MMRFVVKVILIISFSIILMGIIDIFIKEPNRCEMSYMYQPPEYIRIDTKYLAKKFPNYHLYVYGEGSYVDTLRLNEFNGIPVLFVPGNGGSYKQVRSMGTVSPFWANRGYSHLNYFTIDYNEELSAFIGEKLEFQTKFLYYAFSKILELYSKERNTNVILVGHSIGGIIIKSLLTKPYFRRYLKKVSAVFTLATPHSYPAISYDLKTLNFYKQVNDDIRKYRDKLYNHINFISIGGSFQDNIIRSDLILLDSNQYPYDRSILTTAISDVWVSADHLCIVWCRQLMVKLDGLFFDLIDENKNQFIDQVEEKQKIIDYHLMTRPLSGYKFLRYQPNITRYSDISIIDTHLIEGFHLVRRKIMLKEGQQQNYFIKLDSHETLVIYIAGFFQHETLCAGQCEISSQNSSNFNFKCEERVLLLYDRVHLIPNDDHNHARLGHFETDDYLNQNLTHLIIHLDNKSKKSQEYQIIIDRFHTGVRRRNIKLPSFFETFFKLNFLESQLVFTKLASQETMFYELSLEKNFNFIWNTYWAILQTTNCHHQQKSSSIKTSNNDFPFKGFVYLSYPDSRMNQYFWPIKPQKGQKLEFGLLRDHLAENDDDYLKPKILIYLDPTCGYDFLVKYSLSSSVAQLFRHYFSILIPMMISTIIILLCIQFSNVCNRYTFNDNDLTKSKTHHHFKSIGIRNQKCYQLMNASEVMINHHYFAFSFIMIVPNSLLSLILIKSFYPHLDLIHLSQLPLEYRFLICSILFLFSYSIIYVFVILVTHLANNFANGLLFFRIRSQQKLREISTSFFGRIFNFQISSSLVTLFEYSFLALLIFSSIYFIPLNYCLLHFFFTLLMLYRFIKSKSLELEFGQTTSTSLIYSIYPIIFGLLMAMTLINIPYCIDWIFQFNRSKINSRNIFANIIKTIVGHFQDLILLILLKIFIFYIYFTPINLQARLRCYSLNRKQKILNILLLVVSFSNMMFSILTIEFLQINIIFTLMITLSHLCIILNNINNNNNDNNIKEDIRQYNQSSKLD